MKPMVNKVFKNYFSNNEYQSYLISYKTINTKLSFYYNVYKKKMQYYLLNCALKVL